jgi:hypothetical protein
MKLRLFLSLLSLFTISLSSPLHAHEITGFKWDTRTPNTGASITWGYADEGSDCRIGSDLCGGGKVHDISSTILSGGTTTLDTKVKDAFNTWSSIADLVFNFTTDANPDILIEGHSINGSGGTIAHAFTSFDVFPDPVLDLVSISDIHFDTDDTFNESIFNVIAHEIGHTLGLGHVNDPKSLMNPFISGSFVGPQADDIAGIHFLYGPQVTAVPIPSAFWLLLSAFSALSVVPRRRNTVIELRKNRLICRLGTTAWMQKVEQSRSSCREHGNKKPHPSPSGRAFKKLKFPSFYLW